MVLHLILHLNSWQYVDEQMDCSDQICSVYCSKVWYEVTRMIHVKNTDGACCVVFFHFIPKTSIPARFCYDCECWLWMFVRVSNRNKQHICDARLWVGQARSAWCAGQERSCSAVDSGKQVRNSREKRTTGVHKYLFAFVCSPTDRFSCPSSVPVACICFPSFCSVYMPHRL